MTSRRPRLLVLALLVAGLAGTGWVATACFVRSPQPMQVWLDEIEVDITNQVAVKKYRCVFLNPNPRAVVGGTCYMEVEPGAQVDKMSLLVDGKEVKGELLSRKKANQVFSGIIRQGGSPALLEFYGNQLITTKLPRVKPRGKVVVNLQYTTVVKKKSNLVRIRVLNTNPKAKLQPLKRASVTVRIKSDEAIQNVYSPTHDIRVVEGAKDVVTVKWSQDNYLPKTPFVMYYATSNKSKVGVNVLAHREEGEKGYFMAMISPSVSAQGQAAVTPEDILPKDVVFCVDTSYSMNENGKMAQAKGALEYCVKALRAGDRFNIVDFSTEARSFDDKGLVTVDDTSRQRALNYIGDLEATGGTAIHEALELSLKQFADGDRLKMIVFMTDGLPTIGERNPETILKQITGQNKKDVRMFVFGEGYNVNSRMLDVLASDNRGDSDYILPKENIAKRISRFFDKVGSPVMTDIALSFEGIKAEEVYPRQLTDLFKGDQVIVYGRYTDDGKKTVKLTGKVNGQTRTLTYDISLPKESEGNTFVPRLWGGQKVSHLLSVLRKSGENAEMIEEVVHLAKRFGIVTPYTAYLVQHDGMGLQAGQKGKRQQQLASRLRRFGAGGSAAPGPRPPADPSAQREETADADALAETRKALKAGRATTLDYRRGDKKNEAQGRTMRALRYIGTHTFYRRDNVWYDSAFEDFKKAPKLTEVIVGSDAYFALIAKSPRLAHYMALGQVVFPYKGTWYKTVMPAKK